jgi:hypothetical protein
MLRFGFRPVGAHRWAKFLEGAEDSNSSAITRGLSDWMATESACGRGRHPLPSGNSC